MASYNGANIFGPAPTMDHEDRPNAEQLNHYPGVLGTERLDLGYEFGVTTVTGILVGVDQDDLNRQVVAIRQLKTAGAIGTLVDTDGLTWPDAVLHDFRTVGRATTVSGPGVGREYEMRFVHLGYQPSN